MLVLLAPAPAIVLPSFRELAQLWRLLRAHSRAVGRRGASLRGLKRVSRVQAALGEPHGFSAPQYPPLDELLLAARYATLASASYGTFTPLLRVLPNTFGRGERLRTAWRALCRAPSLGPNRASFEAHTADGAALNVSADLRAADIVWAQWAPRLKRPSKDESRAYVPAHLVVVDRASRAVVLVVRGSLGLRDVVADLQVEPEAEDARWLAGCHGGMAGAARRLAALHEARLRELLRANPGYRLVVAGHSLGAGVGFFAALRLRAALRSPFARARVRAYCFAAPCCLPLASSRRHRRMCRSFVFEDDVVPRLSVGSLSHLLAGAALRDDDDVAAHVRRGYARPAADVRFPPGRLRLLPRGGRDADGGGGWRSVDDRRALGVLRLRPSMFRDHGFDRYERALRGLIANRS